MDHSDSAIERRYTARTAASRELYERARNVFPSGVTHDVRCLRPYPVSMSRAEGSRKWDVDGNEYVDYFGGHGAFMLGHNHPAVVEAVREQLTRGTHFGASHELELEWAELIVELVPCAEKVRFTSSGTEASLLAIRIARAFTGKHKILRFISHFHGWHDEVGFAAASHFDGTIPAGIPPANIGEILLCEPNNLDQVQQLLADHDDIAAILIEPTGSTFGQVPTSREYLMQLRKLSTERGVLLVFDEVITGFRVSLGGAQEHYGVTPDLTLLAKTLAGGYPGGAVVGRRDVLDVMTVRDDAKWNVECRVPHQGTFNANPISAIAGLTSLRLIASTNAVEKANRHAQLLRDALNKVIREQGRNWIVYGEFSGFHIFANVDDRDISVEDIYAGTVHWSVLKSGTPGPAIGKIRAALLGAGVDVVAWPGGWSSAVHTDADIDLTATAFKQMLEDWDA